MEKVKIFSHCDFLEKQVNDWIAATKPKITRVLQTQAGDYGTYVILTIFYEDTVDTMQDELYRSDIRRAYIPPSIMDLEVNV
jgi:hypothetical protein